MKQVFRIDHNGFYVEDVLLEDGQETPQDCREDRPPQGLYKPKYNGTDWVEGLSQTEIDAINNQPRLPTVEEQLAEAKAENALLKIRDAGMQEDINFIYETLGG